MNNDLEKKWRKECFDLAIKASIDFHEYENHYFKIAYEKGYLAARKAAQVEIDKWRAECSSMGKLLQSGVVYTYEEISARNDEIRKIVNELNPDCPDSGCYIDLHCSLYELVMRQLKNRDQEIERLKAIIERGSEIRNNWENNEYQEASYYTWLDDENRRIEQHSLNLEVQLKEHDKLIKELRSLGTCDIDCDGVKCSKTCKKKSMIFEKTRKLIGEEK